MGMLRTMAFTALASSALVGTALPADPIIIPTSTPAELPLYEKPKFDWNGFYAGVYGAVQSSPVGDTQYGIGVQAGINAQFDFYLLGAEVAVHGLVGGVGDTSHGQLLGRAGLVVTDDVVIYAAGGYGIDLGTPREDDALLGGGVEVSITNQISVEAQYLHGFPLNGGNAKDQVTIGANYHF